MTAATATASPEPRDDAASRGPIDHSKVMPSFDYTTLMRRVNEATGKGYWAQVREMYRLKFGPGKIMPAEYFYYRLYDETLSPDAKAAFVGHNLRAEMNGVHLDRRCFGIGSDKLAFYACMSGLGLPIPATRAIFHPARFLSGAASLASADRLADWLRDEGNYPFFAKPVDSTASVGIASVDAYHPGADEIELASGQRFPVTRFVEEAERYFRRGYLLQERLHSDQRLADMTGRRLSTIRIMVLNHGGVPKPFRATWRLPLGANQANVLWRGNMMAALDLETGTVGRVIKGNGPGLTEIDRHPDSGRDLIGYRVPDWDGLTEMVVRAASALPGLELTGWDVSLSDRGPIIVELEPDGGDPTVSQLASGRGLLDGPYGEFLQRCRARPKARRWRWAT